MCMHVSVVFVRVYMDTCMCVEEVCSPIYIHIYVCIWGDQRPMSGVFLLLSPHYFLIQILSLTLSLL